jgi:SNF2 family DNA or RNA helicase
MINLVNQKINTLNVIVTKIKRNLYALTFQFDNELIEKIKKLENRKFNPDNRYWEIDSINLYKLIFSYKGRKDIFFDFDIKEKEDFLKVYQKEIKKIGDKKLKQEEIIKKSQFLINLKDELNKNIDSVNYDDYFNEPYKPYRHQKLAVKWLDIAKSGILAADMGLGKTAMMVLTCLLDKSINKALIVCPNSLKFSIADDIEKFFKEVKYHIIKHKKNKYSIEESKIVIVNYEYFRDSNFPYDAKIKKQGLENIDILLCDEAHRLKESSSNTYRNIHKTFKTKCKRFIMSTGTPIKSFAHEIYTLLKFIEPDEFSNKTKFYNEYCGMFFNHETRTYEYIEDKAKIDELNKKLQAYMIRLKKEDVVDLPEKIFNKLIIEMSDDERKRYEEIERGVFDELNKQNVTNASAMTIILRLREYLSSVKAKYTKEIIERLIEEDKKVVFVDFFKKTINYMKEEFKNISVKHSGDENIDQRREAIRKFMNEDDTKLFLGSSSTTKEGLTLTESNYLFLNTLEWTPADNNQIYDRIHRLTTTKTCHYYIPIVKDTIDENIYYAESEKRKVFSKLIDNVDYVDKSNQSIFNEVLEKLKNKYL